MFCDGMMECSFKTHQLTNNGSSEQDEHIRQEIQQGLYGSALWLSAPLE
jgi:hypothetical protein